MPLNMFEPHGGLFLTVNNKNYIFLHEPFGGILYVGCCVKVLIRGTIWCLNLQLLSKECHEVLVHALHFMG